MFDIINEFILPIMSIGTMSLGRMPAPCSGNAYFIGESLDGKTRDRKTPLDVYFQKPKRSKCYNLKGADPDKVKLKLSYFKGRKHLPVVELRKAG